MTLLLQGGHLIDPSQGLNEPGDLLIKDGRIEGVGQFKTQDSGKRIDVSGCIVAPGFIDMHVHLREPGREDKETIETGSRAAVAGGFTSVLCMPNTTPVNDSESITRFITSRAREVGLANVFPAGAVTKGSLGKELAEIGEMVKAGIVAISDDGRPVQNNQVMRRAMEYARRFDIPVLDHCEDLDLAAGGSVNEGTMSTRLGLRGLNAIAEEMHVARDLMLSRITGARVHICHISSRYSLDWVRMARKQGISMTCEVTPHHFILSEDLLIDYDTNLKMNPPLRSKADVEAMLEGLADGTIDCIATDHAPHTTLEKDVTFEEAANGIIGMETAVPLVWNFLVHKGVISVTRAVELLSTNPARILRLDRGTLRKGAVADVTVVDPDAEVTVDVNQFRSKARNCPFNGWKLKGKPRFTIVEGRLVWEG
ncbi:MAG TPA: dihydroorotase [Acidobacteriota bacterium]|nr:dihydroorotase [Acidobacteriota bacterium]